MAWHNLSVTCISPIAETNTAGMYLSTSALAQARVAADIAILVAKLVRRRVIGGRIDSSSSLSLRPRLLASESSGTQSPEPSTVMGGISVFRLCMASSKDKRGIVSAKTKIVIHGEIDLGLDLALFDDMTTE